MKTLVLVRHAKSSWSHPDVNDFDRPLNKRGLRDAPVMGTWLAQQGLQPDAFFSSPACRAITTAQILAEAMHLAPEAIGQDPALYLADDSTLLDVVRSIHDSCETALLVAHNPGLQELAACLTGEPGVAFPTCAMLGMRFAVTRWADFPGQHPELLFHQFPKKLG